MAKRPRHHSNTAEEPSAATLDSERESFNVPSDDDDASRASVPVPSYSGRTTAPMLTGIQEPLAASMRSDEGLTTEPGSQPEQQTETITEQGLQLEQPMETTTKQGSEPGPSVETTEATITETVPPEGAADVAAKESETTAETAAEQTWGAAVGPSSVPSEEVAPTIFISDSPASPVREERQEAYDQPLESPVVLITTRTTVQSPTTGLVSGGASIQLPPLPQ